MRRLRSTTDTFRKEAVPYFIHQAAHQKCSLHPLLNLQQTLGNQAVQRLMRDRAIQATLQLSQPGDVYEQEANRLAKRVVRAPDSAVQQRNEQDLVALGASNGQPRPATVRSYFSPRFGTDFSQIRVHNDKRATQPRDTSEQEADSISETIVRELEAPRYSASIHQKCECSEREEISTKLEEETDLGILRGSVSENEGESQKTRGQSAWGKHGGSSSISFESYVHASKGRGKPLNLGSRTEMGHAFGAYFENVRIRSFPDSDMTNNGIRTNSFLQGRYRSVSPGVQRTIGDGHDLQSPRFAGNPRLEAAFDDESYVRMGARGTHVVILQQALVDAGHLLPKHGADGIFGSETHGAVKSYQDDRSLRVDGIVGPETMGDLDRLFADSPPHPDIPPGPLDFCAVLFEQEALADNDTLVSVRSLTPEQRTAAEELPKVELPDGETAVECKTPSDKKSCADLCGCPLPSSSYTAKVGDLAQVMENATAFHEQDPKPNQDPRKLVCPPKGEPVKIVKIIPSAGSGGITFLEVLFCNGPLPDKNGKMVSEVFIQQRFVENGKQLSIKGPNEIIMPNKITLTAEGAHPGSKPVWSIEHDSNSNGRAKFDGSNRKSSVKIEGTELSSLEGDVTVMVSVCDRSELHKLTVREPFKPGLPVPPVPKTPPGPKKPPGSPPGYCEAIGDREVAKNRRLLTKLQLQAFISTFHSNNKDALELYMTYIDTPKTGAKGVLPPRRLFANEKSDFVKSFISDPETEKERKRIRKLIGDRVKNDPKLIPPEGKTTLLLPFRAVLAGSEIMNLPMSFAEPTKRIPGFVAGGSGKDASDAGDDVRNADGQFRVTNQGGGTLRIQIKYIFDVHDAIDFCPGAHGGPAAWALTIPLSQLEATPDVPTYDTPFEVLYTLTDDIVI